MSTAADRVSGSGRLGRRATHPATLQLLIVVAGVAALAVPTLVSLATEYWSTPAGAHGPLILVSGVWLLFRERKAIRFAPGSISGWWLLAMVPLLAAYAFARGAALLGTESLSLYLLLVLLGFYYWGAATMCRLWFAVLYVAFLIKPPYGLVAELTQPLKMAISSASVSVLDWFGYPVANSGVVIQIAQYQLLVEQACAGLGSLVTLFAMGLLYVHLMRIRDRVRTLILLVSIVPIAVLANLIRVILLVLLTYHAGDAVAQSALHDAAGLITFSLSLAGLFALDRLLELLRSRSERHG